MSNYTVNRLKYGNITSFTTHGNFDSALREFDKNVAWYIENRKSSITGVEIRDAVDDVVRGWYKQDEKSDGFDEPPEAKGFVTRLDATRRPTIMADLEVGDLFERDCENPKCVYLIIDARTPKQKADSRLPIKGIVDLTLHRRLTASSFGFTTPVRKLEVVRDMQVRPV